MKDKNIANVLIEEIFEEEQYDSESIKCDIEMNESGINSNINNWLNDMNEYQLIYEYIYKIKRMFLKIYFPFYMLSINVPTKSISN